MSVNPSQDKSLASTQGNEATPAQIEAVSDAINPVKKFILSHVRGAIVVSVSGAVLLFGASTWNIWQLYQGFQTTISRQFKLQRLSDGIVYYDEVLTMSARMAASTTDPQWEKRYWDNEPKLTAAFTNVSDLVPEVAQAQTTQTNKANQKLIAMEEQAFKLVKAGNTKGAFDLLLSPNYQTQKDIYAKGIAKTISVIDTEIQQLQVSFTRQLQWSLVFAGVSLPFLIFSGSVVVWLIRKYLSDRLKAEEALRGSQQSLIQVNTDLASKMSELQKKSEQIFLQDKQTQSETEQLNHDIEHLLDVLSELETGDLTAKADVNERITGLVSDTLNRLIEQLGKTLSEVVVTANIAAETSNIVKSDAQYVAQDVEQQAIAVNNILSLTDQVSEAAKDSIQTVIDNHQSLLVMAQAVNRGEIAITEMNQGIDVLQSGSDRMVQRVKSLGEFVSLADQFVQDQNQAASLIQVLALNASLVAAKAAEQSDPKKFQLVAREFETIANQVRHLAQQTNTGLESLQQQTTQIHGVVSDVDQEVQGLNGLVQQFSQGVTQTTAVFSEVKAKTQDVESSGKQVTEGNKSILKSAQETSNAMKDIFLRAGRTENRMKSTLNSAIEMKEFSNQLLESVHFFQLESQASAPASFVLGAPPRENAENPPGQKNERTLVADSESQIQDAIAV